MTRRWQWLFALVTMALGAAASASPLDDQLQAIAHASPSSLGVFVEQLERHETAGVNATRRFPLASTFKLPLALVVLKMTDEQRLPQLDSQIWLQAGDMYEFASPLYERMPRGGPSTLREVITSLLEASDNSAANALMRLAGGAAKVRAALAALGFDGISIDRDETEMHLDAYGLPQLAYAERTPQKVAALTRTVRVVQHQRALAAFMADPRDHGTPLGMTKLLARLWRQDLLHASDLDFVRQSMARYTGGHNRIRAGVPAGVPVADRTGTCGGLDDDDAPCVNDVGVLTLPSGEHVALAVYVADAGGPRAAKERLIAQVTRAVWDYFVKLDKAKAKP